MGLAPGLDVPFRRKSVQRCYGRPLWKRSQSNFRFVETKLVGALNMCMVKVPGAAQPMALPDRRKQDLVLLGCRVAVQFVQTTLVSELVAHSTAVCQSVTYERDIITCKYMSEPWVAEASAHFCQQNGRSLWKSLRDAVVIGNVLAGDAGGFVAQKLCLDAYDCCVTLLLSGTKTQTPDESSRLSYILERKEDDIPSIALIDLLGQLGAGGATIDPVKEQLKSIGQENAHVFFNHFIQLEEKITPDLVRQAMRRCCALLLAPGATGADLCLPAFNPKTEELSLLVWIQVKNRNSAHMVPSKQKEWWEHLRRNKIMPPSPSETDEIDRMMPSLGILFSMNPDFKQPIVAPKYEKTVPIVLLPKQEQKSLTVLQKEHEGSDYKQTPFWSWLLDIKSKQKKTSCRQWVSKLRHLCSRSDIPGFVEPKEPEAFQKLFLNGFAVLSGSMAFASIQVPDVLRRPAPRPSLYNETDVTYIRQILKAHELQSTVFDPKRQTEIAQEHILSQATTLAN